jgi:glycosyltransferase involved in cell wall biosynthesis
VAFNGDCKSEYGLDGDLTVVFVGRLHPNKGLDVLLPAFKKIIGNRPDLCWRLWLFGDGPLRAELELLAKQLGISAEVKFWGWVENPAEAYRDQADIFVLPSRTEGVSNALLEAMAYGIPCVATSIGGNTDLIRHNENGLLINPDSEADLVEALLRLVDDATLRQNVGILARQTVQNEYSMDSVAERYIKLYHTLYG